jgi:hypothetical protein
MIIEDWNIYTTDFFKNIEHNKFEKYINILNENSDNNNDNINNNINNSDNNDNDNNNNNNNDNNSDNNDNNNNQNDDDNENNYNIKIKEITELYNNNNKMKEINASSSLNILKKELEIIKLLTKYFLQNKTMEYNFIIISLKILLLLSENLRIKINQKKIINKNNLNILKRSSYKFCLYKHNCMYNYNKKCKYVCYQDHYVHNMVSYDLELLINYIDNNNNNNNECNNKEILKTLNTLNYVIAHMESELKMKCLYIKNETEIEFYHINKKLS